MFMFKNLSTIASSVRNVFTDSFNRSNAGELGEASDGSRWIALRGVFTIFGNKAKATSAANTYPIASISMPDSPLDQDVVITLKGTTPGTGAALWISDTNNWWAVTTGKEVGENCNCDTCSTCNAGNCNAGPCTTNGNCIAGPCNAQGNAFGNFTAGNVNAYTGNNQNAASGGNTNAYTGNNARYFCNAWNFGNCNATNSACSQLGEPVQTGGGNCRAWRSPVPRYCIGWNTRTFSRPCVAYSCDTAGNRFCRASSLTSYNAATGGGNTNTFFPATWNAATGGGNFNGNTFTVTGWNCAGTYCSGTYNCAGYTCTAWTCTNTTFSSCNCQTCFPTYVRVIKSVAGTVSELTRWVVSALGTQLVNSMRITTSGSQITIEPYANADLTSKIGSDLVYTPTGVALASSYGIIVEPSPTSQGFEIDEITIEKI
jgi:hypothetical protein